MPIDSTLRGLALQITENKDPGAQPQLDYQFINAAGAESTLARIRGVPLAGGGGQLAFETNDGTGADTPALRLLVDPQGNLGIGTANPGARLEVAGDARVSGPLSVQGALTAASFTGNGAALSNVTPADGSVSSAKLALDVTSLSKVTGGKMVVNGDNLGIGTASPGARLEVAGDARVDGPLSVQGPLTAAAGLRVSGAGQISGDLSVTGKLTAASFAGNGAGLSNVTPADNSITSAKLANDPAALSKVTGGAMAVSGGKVGIGTASPGARLEVAGDANFTGSLSVQGALTAAGLRVSGAGQISGDLSVTGKLSAAALTGSSLHAGIDATVGPFAMDPLPGRLMVTGAAAELGFFRRTLTSMPATLGAGDRFLWYNPNGSARLYTEQRGDLLTIDASGNVGIGTTNPASRMEVRGDWTGIEGALRLSGDKPTIKFAGGPLAGNQSWILHLGSDGGGSMQFFKQGPFPNYWDNVMTLSPSLNVGIRTANPGFQLDVAGAAHATSFPTSSDDRFKTNIAPLTNVVEKIRKIRGVAFDWNEEYAALGRSTHKREVGVLAKEVKEVFPELVSSWGEQNYLAVDYGRLSAVLLEAAKEFSSAIEALHGRIKALEMPMKAAGRKAPESHPRNAPRPCGRKRHARRDAGERQAG
jgi:cytoskeletal protein CcmA (bactofilin family)